MRDIDAYEEDDFCPKLYIKEFFFGIARDWKQCECPSTGDWLNTSWDIYAMENYPDVEMTEELCYAPVWNTLQNTLLRWRENTK